MNRSGNLAVMVFEFGPPSVLTPADRPGPVAGPGQVLIEVEFANVTFVDTQIRSGHPPNPAMLPALPALLGTGVGGVVSAAGEGVDAGVVGTRVLSRVDGGYLNRCTAPAAGLIPIPDRVPTADAVALMADGRTALTLAGAVAFRPGETVLIEAAAGGVGSLLVQLAARAGARVVALAGGAEKLSAVRELGAEFAIDYREPDWTSAVREAVGQVDVVLDGVGGQIGRDAFTLLGPSGRYSAFGMSSGSFAGIPTATRPDVARVPIGAVTPERGTALTVAALDEYAQGHLRPLVGQRFPLDRAADAHTAIEARGTIGKTLLVTN